MRRIGGGVKMYDRVSEENQSSQKDSHTDLLHDKSVMTGRVVVQRIKDKEKLRKQFEETTRQVLSWVKKLSATKP